MADARFSFTIARPLEEVFAVLTDPEKTPKCSAPAVEEHWITPGPLTIGSRRLAVTRLMGRRSQNIAEVTAYEPNRMWEMKSVSGPPFVARAEFARTDGGTRVDWTWSIDLQGAMRVFAPLVMSLVGRQFTRDFARLKRMMETGEL
jgi:carbon monoxide dehydrogenase subunit G